jgi:dephospho-CoA kinase
LFSAVDISAWQIMKENIFMKIGITGPVASGKSTVSRIFHDLFGAKIIDADFIGKQVLQEDPLLSDKIAKALGDPSLAEKQGLDRKKVAAAVFSDPAKLQILNKLIHPPMLAKIVNEIKISGSRHVVLDAALLLDWDLHKNLDHILFITADKSVRKERLLQKGFSADEAEVRIESQGDWNEKQKQCQWVFINNRGEKELQKQVVGWWKKEIV